MKKIQIHQEYNITCIYKLINPIDSKLFKDENILIYKTYSGNKGF